MLDDMLDVIGHLKLQNSHLILSALNIARIEQFLDVNLAFGRIV